MTSEWSYSVSQVENFACNRKWYLDSILRLKKQSASANLGSVIHKVSEDWQTKGLEPDGAQVVEWTHKGVKYKKYPGQLFMNARHLIPAPGTAVVEGRFKFRLPSGRLFSGALDGRQAAGLPRPKITDLKTTSNPVWALTSAELVANYQANMYSWYSFHEDGCNEVDANWVYLLTEENPNPPKPQWSTKEERAKWKAWDKSGRLLAWAVNATLYYAQVRKVVEAVDDTTAKMERIRLTVLNPKDVAPNLDVCPKYGGCSHRNTPACVLTTGQVYTRLLDKERQHEMALSDLVQRANQEQQALGAPPPVVQAQPAPVAVSTAVSSWTPGDPLNTTQKILAGLKKPLLAIAMAADEAPAIEAIMSWPGANLAYSYNPESEATQVMHPAVLARFTASANEAIAAVAAGAPPPVAAGTPVGVPESGRINPPEAPAVAAADPDQAAALHVAAQALTGATAAPPPVVTAADEPGDNTFKALKAEVERLGLNPEGKKLKTPGMQKLLDTYWAAQPKPAAPAVDAPPPVVTVPAAERAAVVSSFERAAGTATVPHVHGVVVGVQVVSEDGTITNMSWANMAAVIELELHKRADARLGGGQ